MADFPRQYQKYGMYSRRSTNGTCAASKNLHRGLKFFKKRTDSLRVGERPPTTFDHFNLRARSNPSVMVFVPMQLHGTTDTLLTDTSRHVSHVNTQYINAVKIDDSG